MKSKVLEVPHIHPRVAGYLSSSNWCFEHHYRTGGETLDFVAIHRDRMDVAMIECKRFIESLDSVIMQIRHNHRALGIPHAIKVLFVLDKPTKRHLYILGRENILVQGVDLIHPCAPYPDSLLEFQHLLTRLRFADLFGQSKDYTYVDDED